MGLNTSSTLLLNSWIELSPIIDEDMHFRVIEKLSSSSIVVEKALASNFRFNRELRTVESFCRKSNSFEPVIKQIQETSCARCLSLVRTYINTLFEVGVDRRYNKNAIKGSN